jgi:hypothetical protein
MACFMLVGIKNRRDKFNFNSEARVWNMLPTAKPRYLRADTLEKVSLVCTAWQKAGAAFMPAIPWPRGLSRRR